MAFDLHTHFNSSCPSCTLVVSVDPGKKGGIVVLKYPNIIIHPMPILTSSHRKRIKGVMKDVKKTHLDFKSLINIFQDHSKNKNKILICEKVHSGQGEGVVSSFGFGEGFGVIQGGALALDYQLELVSPQSWKKTFPELQNSVISSLKDDLLEAKDNKDTNKVKQINQKIKNEAKKSARSLASSIVPSQKDQFKKVQDDGKAEALLIGLHCIAGLSKNNKK